MPSSFSGVKSRWFTLQGSTKRWARGTQGARVTQPKAHILVEPSIVPILGPALYNEKIGF